MAGQHMMFGWGGGAGNEGSEDRGTRKSAQWGEMTWFWLRTAAACVTLSFWTFDGCSRATLK